MNRINEYISINDLYTLHRASLTKSISFGLYLLSFTFVYLIPSIFSVVIQFSSYAGLGSISCGSAYMGSF